MHTRIISRFNFALTVCVALSTPASAASTEFAAFGDMPYSDDQIAVVKEIGAKLRDLGVPFVIHYGDAKSGGDSCDDATLTGRKDLLYGLMPGRVFYTPGDNEWTDCDRDAAGGFDETERLAKVREIFFSDGLPAEPEWHIARQGPDYPENARWEYGELVFATVHIVGTDNGRRHIDKSDRKKALDDVDKRDKADLAWLDAAFEAAKATDAEGVVVAMQADPFGDVDGKDPPDVECTHDVRVKCNPYLGFVRHLRARAAAFGKPVLLIHGSTSEYCLDRRFGGAGAPKLWRLNGPGDFAVLDAAVVDFDAAGVEPFSVRGLLDTRSPLPCMPQ
jgi:hypothetical protein